MAFLLSMAALLSKFHSRFERFRSTMWLLTTIYVYTFGATIISDLFMVFPCFKGAGENMMLHDPSTSCYGYSMLMVLVPIAICAYTAAAVYVLGFAFWGRKAIIQQPANHDKRELEATFKEFGFLFYGTHNNISPTATHTNVITVSLISSRDSSSSVAVTDWW